MNAIFRSALRLIDRLSPPETVHAHCDIPCGIYDPHYAQVAALSVIRMNQLIRDLGDAPGPGDKAKNDAWHNSLTRYVVVKEEHAELVKREVRIIWGDYFKPEHVEKYPDLHANVFNIMKLASQARQNVDMQAAESLLSEVNKFAEVFWETKGVATKRQPSNQAAGGEYAVPAN
jgi:nickel superoxide dismutase